MDEDLKNKIHKVYIPHLQGKFEEGQVILFTGCGFSRGAKNILGNPMPLVEDMKRVYWDITYPGQPFEDSSSLQDLYDAALEKHKSETAQKTVQFLTTETKSILDYYKLLFSFPWLRAYTLNIDDLAQAASRNFELPRRINAISATAPDNNSYFDRIDRTKLNLIHLNGSLPDVPDFITFSTTQYAERIANDDPWYAQLSADFVGRPVVFIGTSLDESPLWKHVEIRRERGRDTGELRPRSYLVTPSLPRARQDLLTKHNVVWLPFNTEEFVQEVLKPLESSIPVGLKILSSRSDSHAKKEGIPFVADLASDKNRIEQKTEYLLGQEPEWSDIHSGRAAERDCDRIVWDTLAKSLAQAKVKPPVVLTGTVGSGKSTSLMRAALKLSAQGIRVGWIDRSIDRTPLEVVKSLDRDPAPQVIAIDDADVYGSQLSQIIRDCSTHEKHPLVLVELRANRVDRAINSAQLRDCKPEEVSMELLSDADIDRILAVLDKENRLGKLKGLTLGQRRDVFKSRASRELIVAMYEATTGLDFRTKMIEELYELDGVSKLIYATVAVASAYRFDLTRDEIVIATGDVSNNTHNSIELLIRRHLIVYSPSDRSLLRCRHRVIASVLIEALTQRGEMYKVVRGLIVAAMTKQYESGERGRRPGRIIKKFINHDFIFNTLDLDQGRILYASLESVLKNDYHFWLQRGSMEVEWGSIDRAENFLSQAISSNDRDPLVRNEWAYLLFKKANKFSGSMDAPNLVQEATDRLLALINDPHGSSPHPYHVLTSQGLAWSRRGIRDPEAKKQYLTWLSEIIEKGVKAFPQIPQMQGMKKDIQEELLSLAVRR